jgi:hypothetical protein
MLIGPSLVGSRPSPLEWGPAAPSVVELMLSSAAEVESWTAQAASSM